MGEIISKYGKVQIGVTELEVELNGPICKEFGGIVHLQNEKCRVELTQVEFYRLVAEINLSYKNLQIIKGVNLHE